jgi:hypothetical protein
VSSTPPAVASSIAPVVRAKPARTKPSATSTMPAADDERAAGKVIAKPPF